MKDRIRKIRKDNNLTQVEFGERIGVKGNTITNYEKGLRNPTNAVLSMICKEFNVYDKWLKDGIGEPYINTTLEDDIAEFVSNLPNEPDSSFKKKLLGVMAKLTEEQWEVLADIAEELANLKS